MILTNRQKLLSCILCAVLAWTVAFGITGCTGNTETPETGTPAVSTTAEGSDTVESTADTTAATTADSELRRLGEGDTKFTLSVTDGNGAETLFEIATDKTTVGEALTELGLIEGEEGAYGLYIKKVNGILADYDTDGTYWAFYIDGEYAMTGIDQTTAENGHSYALKVEK